jgi:hypothetical protein
MRSKPRIAPCVSFLRLRSCAHSKEKDIRNYFLRVSGTLSAKTPGFVLVEADDYLR